MATAKRLYDEDFYAWTQEQAAVLRAARGVNTRLDVENLAEEIEDMGRADRRALRSFTTNLLMHLLKWVYQPDKRSGSWEVTIRQSRREIRALLDDSPSLYRHFQDGLETWFGDARKDAASETGLPPSTFPEEPCFPDDRLLAEDWLPE